MTIVSIYNSRCHNISNTLLSALFQQLPKTVILTVDFNSYHQIGKNPTNNNRECQVQSFINNNQLNILNDARHIKTSGTSISAIDLTITSPSLQPILSWNVTDSPFSCHHCMITENAQEKIQNLKLQSQNSTSTKQTDTSLHIMEYGRKSQIQIDHNLLKL